MENTCQKEKQFELETKRIDEKFRDIGSLIETEMKRIDDKFKDGDVKYQIQFNAAKEALGIALIAQEKDGAKSADSTKEAINKAEIATDKRFQLLSEKIDTLAEILSKNAGAQGIYVTHTDLSVIVDKIQTGFNDALKPLVSQVNILTAAQNSTQGRSGGAKDMYGWIVGGVMFLIAVASFVMTYSK